MKRTRIDIGFIAVLLVCALFVKGEASPPNNSEQIINHLEFLGYKIQTTKDSLIAKHPKRLPLHIRLYEGGILCYSYVTLKESAKSDRLEYLKFINRLNALLTTARAIAYKDDLLKFEGWYPGDYEKGSFGLFLGEWNNDLSHLIFREHEGIEQFLK